MKPIDSLVKFIRHGEPEDARNAFPPGYIKHKLESHQYASGLMSEDTAIKLIRRMITAALYMEYGEISDIKAFLISREELEVSPNEDLSEYGVEERPEKMHALGLILRVTSDKGVFSVPIEPRVILIDGNWYIHPADVDKLYGL